MTPPFFRHSIPALAVAAGLFPTHVQSASTGNINLDAIHAADAYEQGFDGSGIRIGILDSGFDISHAAYAGKDIASILSEAYKALYADDPDWASHNHGTHVAAIAAGGSTVDYGVAKNASLLLLSSTLRAEDSVNDPAELYRAAYDAFPDVKIYSNSWGWVRGLNAYAEIPEETDAFRAIFSGAVEKDKLLVFAAGNQGGLAPGDPILPNMRNPAMAGHMLNVVNIEADHLFEPGHFIHGNSSAVEASNLGLFASLWTIAAPGTDIPSASAGTTDGTITMTGTSMAAPHVSGTLALVQQAFPWMSASQLADVVLSTARKPDVGAYDVIAFHPNPPQHDPSRPNPDFKWQFGGNQDFTVADPQYSPDTGRYEANVRLESGAIVFWGDAGLSGKTLSQIKAEAAERASAEWLAAKLEDAEWEFDRDAYLKAVYEALEAWKAYFIENSIVVEYGIGAGLLDAGKAVGGLAELNVNRMARWDEDAHKWKLPLNETGLGTEPQLAYELQLSGNAVSRFRNDIAEVAWNPTLHITTEEEFNDYNAQLAQTGQYVGSGVLTMKPENADLPVSLVISGRPEEGGIPASAGTLVFTGHASHRGTTDVVKGAVLIVNGLIDGVVRSDADGTVGGTGVVGGLLSQGTLSPGDDTCEETRLGTLTVNGRLELAPGSALVLDVSEHLIDQIRVADGSADGFSQKASGEGASAPASDGNAPLSITIRTGGYIDHNLSIAPRAFFPDFAPNDPFMDQIMNAELAWAGGITFNFRAEDGFFKLERVEDGMTKVVDAASLGDRARRRAGRLDAAIAEEGSLQNASAELVSWIDAASEHLAGAASDDDRVEATAALASVFGALEPDAYLALDAAALDRTIRLRELSSLSPLASAASTEAVPRAALEVERTRMMEGSKRFRSTRTVFAAGADRGFGGWAAGWRLGVFTDDVDAQDDDQAEAEGLFASGSALWELPSGVRIFGEAALSWGREDRRRTVQEARYENTVELFGAGAALGVGRKFDPDALPLSVMPYLKLSWDGVSREGFSEGDSKTSLSFSREWLRSTALEAGLAFESRPFSEAFSERFFLQGKAAYRNRLRTSGDESYAWAGINDQTHLEFFENRHAATLQCAFGWQISPAQSLALTIGGEAGSADAERINASLRWQWLH